MSSSNLGRLVSLLLLLAFPVSMMWADSSMRAMLYASGTVALNGSQNRGTSAVFIGDTIQTPDKSTVTLSLPGSTVLIPSNSAVVYEGKAVQLDSGKVSISTTKGMAARVNSLTVTPVANGTAHFQVAKLDGAISVAAERGAVVISDGTTSTVVQEGNTQTTNDQPPEKDNKKKKGAAAPPPAASQGVGGMSKTVLTVTAIGAATAGIVAAIVTTGPPMSPDR